MEKYKKESLGLEEFGLNSNEIVPGEFLWFAGGTINGFYSSKILEIQELLKTKSLEDFESVNINKSCKEYASSIKVNPIKIIKEGIVEVKEVNQSLCPDEMFYQFIYQIEYHGNPILFELYHESIPELFCKPYKNEYDIARDEGFIGFELVHAAEELPSREELVIEANIKVKGFRDIVNTVSAQMKLQGDSIEGKIKALISDRYTQLLELERLNQDYVEVFFQAKE